jgi:hypothetical protein
VVFPEIVRFLKVKKNKDKKQGRFIRILEISGTTIPEVPDIILAF